MKIDIVQFTPVPGGESTWTKATSLILQEMGHEVRVITPTRSGKKLSGFMEMPNQHFIKEALLCDELQNAEIIYFVNSIHLQKSKRKSEEEKTEMFNAVRPIFEGIKNKKVIMHEHGNMYSNHLYRYTDIINILHENGNRVVMTTNLRSSVSKYEEMGIPAFVTRQPFYPAMYPQVPTNTTKKPIFSFNSRYTATKRPQLFLPLLDKYFKNGDDFEVHFKGNKNDNVTIWYKLTEYFTYPQVSIKKNVPDMTVEVSEIYENADYCVYPGPSVVSEKGRVEYSMMEAWYYGLPLIVGLDVMEKFNTIEFGYSDDMIFAGMIPMNQNTIDRIMSGNFTEEERTKYVRGGKELLKEFLPDAFKERMQKALDFLNSEKKFVKKEKASLF
jgi:glycosyltransferase involved in cell wall biosynthesis